MVHHRVVTVLASGVLIFLTAGCATERDRAASNLAASAAAVPTSQLNGTWRGEIWAVGTDSTTTSNRDVTLEIKDDATYRMTFARMGTTTGNDSGVAVRDGDAVILKSSQGQWIRLQRSGDKLHGVLDSSGRRMHIMVEQAP